MSMEDAKMSTNSGKRRGLLEEHHQRVQTSSESGHEFKSMTHDKDKYLIPYSPLSAEYDPGCRRQ